MSLLTQMLMARLGGTGTQELGRALGADEGAAGKGLQAAVPLLFSALAKNAASPDGRAGLERAIARDHDGSILDGAAGALNPEMVDQGRAILGHVFGARLPEAEQGVSRASGLPLDQAGKLLAMVAPMVMGALGKARKEQGLDTSGLAGLLAGERAAAAGSLGGLAAFLDRDGDGDIADDVLGGLAKGLKGRLFGR